MANPLLDNARGGRQSLPLGPGVIFSLIDTIKPWPSATPLLQGGDSTFAKDVAAALDGEDTEGTGSIRTGDCRARRALPMALIAL